MSNTPQKLQRVYGICVVRQAVYYVPCRLQYLPYRTDRMIMHSLYLIIQAHFGQFCRLIRLAFLANGQFFLRNPVGFRLPSSKFIGSLYLRSTFLILIAMRFKFLRVRVTHSLLELLAQAASRHLGVAVGRFAVKSPWAKALATAREPSHGCYAFEQMSFFINLEPCRTALMSGSVESCGFRASTPRQLICSNAFETA